MSSESHSIARTRAEVGIARPKIDVHRIPAGYQGTLQTVRHVTDLIKQGAKDFGVRQTAISILRRREVKPKDYIGEIKALFEWVQQNIRYTKDTYRVEVLHTPQRMLELRAGDCDDMTILLGALLESIGHPVRLVLTGPDGLRPELFSHIYLEVSLRGRWIPLDATMPHPMGWAPRTPIRKVVDLERKSDMMAGEEHLQGLGAAASVPSWMGAFLRALGGEAIRPKDERVKQLWVLLRTRQLLDRSPWLKAVLRRIWQRGLSARPRPRTVNRIVGHLGRWGLLPPPHTPQAKGSGSGTAAPAMQSVQPVTLRPVAAVQPAALQPIKPTAAPVPSSRAATP